MAHIANLHDLIDDLERRSPVIGLLNLKSTFPDSSLEGDQLTFANQDHEKELVAVALENLLNKKSLDFEETEKLAGRLFNGGNFMATLRRLPLTDGFSAEDCLSMPKLNCWVMMS